MVLGFWCRNMAKNTQPTKKQLRTISNLDERERALLSIILMNNGHIKETKLKRVYLEKYTLWDLQSISLKLKEVNLMARKGEDGGSGATEIIIPGYLHHCLEPQLVSEQGYSGELVDMVPSSVKCCGEYTILWNLIQIDTLPGFSLIDLKNRGKLPTLRKIADLLGILEDNSTFMFHLLKSILEHEFFKKNGIENWRDVIDSPHGIIEKIYRLVYYDLRDSKNWEGKM
jgi:hypothetical protein